MLSRCVWNVFMYGSEARKCMSCQWIIRLSWHVCLLCCNILIKFHVFQFAMYFSIKFCQVSCHLTVFQMLLQGHKEWWHPTWEEMSISMFPCEKPTVVVVSFPLTVSCSPGWWISSYFFSSLLPKLMLLSALLSSRTALSEDWLYSFIGAGHPLDNSEIHLTSSIHPPAPVCWSWCLTGFWALSCSCFRCVVSDDNAAQLLWIGLKCALL